MQEPHVVPFICDGGVDGDGGHPEVASGRKELGARVSVPFRVKT